MTELVARTRLLAPTRPTFGGLLIVERNAMVYRRTWMILFSGFFEPLFYLFFFVYPLGDVIGNVAFDQETLEYAAFVAPALLAASAMNGAFYDATNDTSFCACAAHAAIGEENESPTRTVTGIASTARGESTAPNAVITTR